MTAWTAEAVIERLEEACRTLLSLPSAGVRPAGHRTYWPDIVRSFEEAYGYSDERLRPTVPSAEAITRMDEAFGWLQFIELSPAGRKETGEWSTAGGAMLRRIVLLRAMTHPATGRHIYSWRKIAGVFSCSDKSVTAWHAKAIGIIKSSLTH